MTTSTSNAVAGAAASATRVCHALLAALTLLLLLQAADIETKRTGYRLYKSVGRNSVDYDANVGSGRGLFRNLLGWRNTWPQKPFKNKFLPPTTTTSTTTMLLNNTITNDTLLQAPRQRVTRRYIRVPISEIGSLQQQQRQRQRRRNTRQRPQFRTLQPYTTNF